MEMYDDSEMKYSSLSWLFTMLIKIFSGEEKDIHLTKKYLSKGPFLVEVKFGLQGLSRKGRQLDQILVEEDDPLHHLTVQCA